MATISARGSIRSGYIMKLNVNVGSMNISSNYTPVSWNLTLESTDGYSFAQIGSTVKAYVDGEVYNAYSQKTVGARQRITITSGSKNIYHNADGTKSISYSFSYDQSTLASYTPRRYECKW